MLPAKESPAYTRLHAMTSDLVQCAAMDEQHGSTYGHVQLCVRPQATGKPRQKSLQECHANGLRTAKAMATTQVFYMQPCRTLGMRLPR